MKMIRLFLVGVALCCSSFLKAQISYSWAETSDGSSGEYANHLLRDENGNSIVIGAFTGTMYLGQGTQVDTVYNVDVNFTSQDLYVQLVNSKGNHVWVKSIGAVDLITVTDAFIQPQTGNIVLCGTFSGPVDFDPGSGVVQRSPAGIFSNGYVLMLDAQGDFVEVITYRSSTVNSIRSIAPFNDGSFVVAGYYVDSLDVDPSSGSTWLTTATNTSFLAKYTPLGALDWAKSYGDDPYFVEVVRQQNGQLYTVGNFQDSMNIAFAPQQVNISAAAYSNTLVIASYDSLGNYGYHRTFDLLGNTAMSGGSAFAPFYAFEISPAGEAHIGGSYGGQLRIDSTQTFSSPQAYRAFLIKLQSDGTLDWAREFGGLGGANNAAQDRVEVIDFLPDSTLMVAGNFTGPEDMDPGPGVHTMGFTYGIQGWVAKWTPQGSFIAARDWEAAIGSTINDGLSDGHDMYVCGTYRGTTDMDFGAGTDVRTAFSINAHVMKLGCDYLTVDTLQGVDSIVYQQVTYRDSGVWVYDTLSALTGCDSVHGVLMEITTDTSSIGVRVWDAGTVEVYPNPAADWVQFRAPDYQHYRVFDPHGRLLVQGTLPERVDVRNWPPGMYLIQLVGTRGTIVRKVLKR
jgi:hypothetical protein